MQKIRDPTLPVADGFAWRDTLLHGQVGRRAERRFPRLLEPEAEIGRPKPEVSLTPFLAVLGHSVHHCRKDLLFEKPRKN